MYVERGHCHITIPKLEVVLPLDNVRSSVRSGLQHLRRRTWGGNALGQVHVAAAATSCAHAWHVGGHHRALSYIWQIHVLRCRQPQSLRDCLYLKTLCPPCAPMPYLVTTPDFQNCSSSTVHCLTLSLPRKFMLSWSYGTGRLRSLATQCC